MCGDRKGGRGLKGRESRVVSRPEMFAPLGRGSAVGAVDGLGLVSWHARGGFDLFRTGFYRSGWKGASCFIDRSAWTFCAAAGRRAPQREAAAPSSSSVYLWSRSTSYGSRRRESGVAAPNTFLSSSYVTPSWVSSSRARSSAAAKSEGTEQEGREC